MDKIGWPRPAWLARLSPRLIARIALAAALALFVAGLGYAVYAANSNSARPAAFQAPGPSADGSAAPAPSPAPATGPRAGATAVKTDGDLGKVCDGWYYPKSPKFAGKAPHQISIGVIDSILAPSRHMASAVRVPDMRERVWRAWAPDNPARSQLVACVDLTRAGKKLKSCKYPGGPVDLVQGIYRIRLYEAATGRKLLDKPLTGADGNCPSVPFQAAGEGLFSEVSDAQLYTQLRSYVMKK